jgi:hypothetical protein
MINCQFLKPESECNPCTIIHENQLLGRFQWILILPVMKKHFTRFLFSAVMLGTISVFTLPAQAGRNGGNPPSVIVDPKPVVSGI